MGSKSGPSRPSNLKNQAVTSELQDYLITRKQRRWYFPRAALVGLVSGMVALGFRIALAGADALRGALLNWAHRFPALGWVIPILFTMTGAVIAVFMTRKFAPEASGSGIPFLEGVLQRIFRLKWQRLLPVKFFGGILAIGSGLALGREGPTIQMGGAVGDAISRLIKATHRQRFVLISAGAGAGLSAAFNAPLSGLIFVLEEVRRDFQPIVFGASFIAAVVANIVARIGSGQFPVFSVPKYLTPPLSAVPMFMLLGIVAGLMGVLFNRGLMLSIRLYSKVPKKLFLFAVALTGGLIGLSGWFSPLAIGSGHHLAEIALRGELATGLIPLFFLIRFLFTTASYGTGAPGGIFAPLLCLGAMIGLGVGRIGFLMNPAMAPVPAAFAVVGMAAYFTAIVRAPLTGIVLIIEMTGNYSLMLPLLVSCFCAYSVGELLKDEPIYEALLARDVRLKGEAATLKEAAVVDFIVQPGSAFDGRFVRSLGLPAGCILIRCSDGKNEWIPRADTRLEPHVRITAVIAPDAEEGLEILREGTEEVNLAEKKHDHPLSKESL